MYQETEFPQQEALEEHTLSQLNSSKTSNYELMYTEAMAPV